MRQKFFFKSSLKFDFFENLPQEIVEQEIFKYFNKATSWQFSRVNQKYHQFFEKNLKRIDAVINPREANQLLDIISKIKNVTLEDIDDNQALGLYLISLGIGPTSGKHFDFKEELEIMLASYSNVFRGVETRVNGRSTWDSTWDIVKEERLLQVQYMNLSEKEINCIAEFYNKKYGEGTCICFFRKDLNFIRSDDLYYTIAFNLRTLIKNISFDLAINKEQLLRIDYPNLVPYDSYTQCAIL